ncbi:hypothetical protein RB597_008778 [Gaeumannomyces tritici]
MAVSHASLGPAAVAFLAGSLAMMFFIILAGVADSPPLNNTYFLEASTDGVRGARSTSRWTYLHVCGPANLDCSPARPAPGVGSAWPNGGAGAPTELLGPWDGNTTSEYYWYMWRFGWVLFLIALFFEVMAFFASFIACLGRLGSAVAGLVSMGALFFLTIAVALMTATFVKMRDAFLAAGTDAHIGTYAFGFAWGAWAALLIATGLLAAGVRGGSKADRSRSRRWGKRQRSVRSRRPHEMGSRRVKDNYA